LTSWTHIDGKLRRIDVGPDGNAWGVNSAGSIYRWDGAKWHNIPGKATDISCGSDGVVWVVNSADNIYRLNDDQLTWT
jgi:streptogramin lyase